MEIDSLDELPKIVIGSEYTIRTFEPGDEAGLGRVYFASALNAETVEQVRSLLHAHPCFKPERVFVALAGDRIVGTASAWRSSRDPEAGYLHMLSVLPDHRGKNLGAALTVETLRYTRNEGLTVQRLLTDDWRRPAIRLYLSLGYVPIIVDATHQGRWQKLGLYLQQPDIVARARTIRSS
jgi:mycothiol synthase